MSSLFNGLGDLIVMLGKGLSSFVNFITSLPNLFYQLIDIIPSPLHSFILVFISIILFIIVLKVVHYFA